MRLETKAIHSGLDVLKESIAVVPPLNTSTIFEHDQQGSQPGDLNYTRAQNPNRAQLEALIADLEEGEACATFSSGVAAAAAVFQALEPGDHVIMPEDVYHGNRQLMKQLMTPWGLQCDYVDMTDLNKVEDVINSDTKLLWIETPSNPMLLISDIAELCKLAKSNDLLVCVDNTWPTPVNQLPLELGADLSLHSTTKYFGGHSDILGGAVVAKQEEGIFKRIRQIQITAGAVPSPRDCWLLSRSIRTLPYRMRGHNENAGHVARFLQDHPKVDRVFYPGLESDPGNEIAKNQMNGYGGMVSFLYSGKKEQTIRAVGRSELILRATSLGGVESTWEHRRSSEGEDSTTPQNLIRISVGLEHPEDLLEDLGKALG
ncbi:aminotransferase class I/II-fold pyridoxal phosphate-dependent enzyme [Aliifodinibius sp. S!AR15-10]|uniref:trans-sulfuration enzyme family protein n=1 Tax=Aliifodinibius sp. S!AR15-10 TaxID=2950437 RepID=UPI00285A08CD|nr:aminotransferase class I/II-fold pyridoxal phosphate-dependent enzyme [Aliifodinibius sp. S!AR15-10]MDR8391986.1 aminotransferase class I/II-fold pyridoxal phosphate-dependent enzyme [Aliifodinibius sp. S!AR15-10]